MDGLEPDIPEGVQEPLFDQKVEHLYEDVSRTTFPPSEAIIEADKAQSEFPLAQTEESVAEVVDEVSTEPIVEPEATGASVDEETIRLAADFTIELVGIVKDLVDYHEALRFAAEIPGCSKINRRSAPKLKISAWEYVKRHYIDGKGIGNSAAAEIQAATDLEAKAGRLLSRAESDWGYWANFELEELKLIILTHFRLIIEGKLEDRQPGILGAVEEAAGKAKSDKDLLTVIDVFYTGPNNKTHRAELHRKADRITASRERGDQRPA